MNRPLAMSLLAGVAAIATISAVIAFRESDSPETAVVEPSRPPAESTSVATFSAPQVTPSPSTVETATALTPLPNSPGGPPSVSQGETAGAGSVCGVWSSSGIDVTVGEDFYILARIEDNFQAEIDVKVSGEKVSSLKVSTSVIVSSATVYIDGGTGGASLVGRVDSLSEIVNAWNGTSFGEAGERQITPVGRGSLTVVNEMAGPGASGLSSFFLNRASDSAAAAGAASNCGRPPLTFKASLTALNHTQALPLMAACRDNPAQATACSELDDALGLSDGADRSLRIDMDGWIAVKLRCNKPGDFSISVVPGAASQGFANDGRSIDLKCG